MKSDKIINNILKVNTKITNNISETTEFEDQDVENLFQIDCGINSYYKNILSNTIIFLGYLATLPYVFFAFYRFVYTLLFIGFFLASLIFLILAFYYNTRKMHLINSHVQIFLSTIFLIVKGFVLLRFYPDKEGNDNIEEILRLIIYHFISTGVFLVTNVQANLYVFIFYFFNNLALIIYAYIKSSRDRYFHMEIFTSFCLSIIFFALRKQWDFQIRSIFGQKLKYEKLFLYAIEYIDGLNGFNMNFRNKSNVFYSKKASDLIQILQNEDYLIPEKQKEGVDEFQKNKNENILLIQFLKKLSFYRMNKKIQKDPFGILNYSGNFFINFSYKFFIIIFFSELPLRFN